MMSVPMQADNGDIVGVLQLINRKKDFRFVITPENATDNTLAFDRSDQVLIEALSNVAAVCVQRTQLMASQDQLLDWFEANKIIWVTVLAALAAIQLMVTIIAVYIIQKVKKIAKMR